MLQNVLLQCILYFLNISSIFSFRFVTVKIQKELVLFDYYIKVAKNKKP